MEPYKYEYERRKVAGTLLWVLLCIVVVWRQWSLTFHFSFFSSFSSFDFCFFFNVYMSNFRYFVPFPAFYSFYQLYNAAIVPIEHKQLKDFSNIFLFLHNTQNVYIYTNVIIQCINIFVAVFIWSLKAATFFFFR